MEGEIMKDRDSPRRGGTCELLSIVQSLEFHSKELEMKKIGSIRWLFLVVILALSLVMFGCEGDDGDRGPAGPPGPPGPGAGEIANEQCEVCHGPGGIRDIGVVHPDPLANNLTFSNFSVDATDLTAVSVTFEAAGPNGPITDDPETDFSGSLTFVKLMPGAAAGDRSFWQSYINRVEDGDVGPVEGEPAVLAEAVQATSESTSAGNLVFDGLNPAGTAGVWTYTFAFDFSQVGVTDIDGDDDEDVPAGTLDFAPDNTNRISGQFSANEVALGDEDFLVQQELEGNPVFDFVPNGGALPLTRNIAVVESCNECHRELALHGGHRFEVEYCVTCHNPGTTDANSGNTVDLTTMIHKIHRGESLPSVENGEPYVIVGYRDSIHDYSTVVWPGFPIGEPLDCAKCHTGAEGDPNQTADGDNWNTAPTAEACSACHDDVDFVTGEGHLGGPQPNNSLCAGCHPATGLGVGQSVVDAHEILALTAATAFEAGIDDAASTFDAATRELDIVFSIVDPANGPWDILVDDPFVQGGSSTSILVGWDPQEINNTGSGSAPAQPIRINALTDAVDNGDGAFTVTAAIPEGIDSVRVAVEGHPVVDGTRVPMTNVFADLNTGAAPTSRREIVDIDKCNACHGALSLHGSNRTNEIGVCVICHNPNATDIEVRPATVDTDPADGVFDDFAVTGVDGKREEAIDFKRMIHAIHAGEASEDGIRDAGVVIYGFNRSIHDYSEVRYPTGQNNCDMCHIGDGPPDLPLSDEVLATTVRTGDAALDGDQEAIDAALTDPDDDLNITRTAAVCSSCHDGGVLQGHMESNGANFGITQPEIDAQQ
jgi:OmcA/MtrC family decaheme c-type cytochrome